MGLFRVSPLTPPHHGSATLVYNNQTGLVNVLRGPGVFGEPPLHDNGNFRP